MDREKLLAYAAAYTGRGDDCGRLARMVVESMPPINADGRQKGIHMAYWNIPPQVEEQLEGVARDEALLSQEGHSYLPNTPEEASGFTPHEWVLEAMRRADSMGFVAGRAAAKEEIRNALGLR